MNGSSVKGSRLAFKHLRVTRHFDLLAAALLALTSAFLSLLWCNRIL